MTEPEKSPSPSPAAPSRPAAGLLVQALGPLRIVRDGVALEREAWNSAKPRELLVFLLCHPTGCTREQVGLAFWPEASAEQVRNNFHVTLHRLRKTLGGTHWITLADDRYAIDPAAAIAFDAARFERDLPLSRTALARGRDPVPLQEVLALYRGDFLESENAGDWHLEWRDRLRRLLIEGLMHLGEWFVAQSGWQQAEDAFRRVIAREELHEPAYRHLMTCLARRGERAEALRLYQRLSRLLKDELDAEPEAETTAIFGRLQLPEAV